MTYLEKEALKVGMLVSNISDMLMPEPYASAVEELKKHPDLVDVEIKTKYIHVYYLTEKWFEIINGIVKWGVQKGKEVHLVDWMFGYL